MVRTNPAGRTFGIVALGTSAGGVAALGRVLAGLPADFPVPVVAVQHLDPRHRTILADVLSRRTSLSVTLATHSALARPGVAYIAPPDRHLLIGAGGWLKLSGGERVHFSRPSVDLLFESAAVAYGPRVLACVLTGTGSDGATGAVAVKARGGTVIVEDPELAEFKGMPKAAVAAGAEDFVLPIDEIAGAIIGLVSRASE